MNLYKMIAYLTLLLNVSLNHPYKYVIKIIDYKLKFVVFCDFVFVVGDEMFSREWMQIYINLLATVHAIWHRKIWSTMAQVMAYCLTALSHYLNQCWHIITQADWGVRGDLFWYPSWSVASCWCNATPRKTNSLPLAWDTSITSGVTDKYAARVPVPSPC